MSDETKTQLAFAKREALTMYHRMRGKYNRLLKLAHEYVPKQLLLNLEIEEHAKGNV